MKLLVFSDVHSNWPALKEVSVFLDEADAILCLGDVVGYNSFPNECIGFLRARKAPCIRGNHDQTVLDGNISWFNPVAAEAIEWTRKKLKKENLAFLEKLPLSFETAFEGKRVVAYHGSPHDPLHEYVMPYEAKAPPKGVDVLALGHTHVPFVKKFGNSIVFNPGSVGQPRDGDPRASFAWLELPSIRVKIQRVTYNVSETVEANKRAGLPLFLAQRLWEGI